MKMPPTIAPRRFPIPPTIMAAMPLIPGSIPIKGETIEKLRPKRMPLAPARTPVTKEGDDDDPIGIHPEDAGRFYAFRNGPHAPSDRGCAG